MDQAAHRSARAVDTVIESPIETVEQTLNVETAAAVTGIVRPLGKACEQELLFVRDAVVIGISEIPDIGRGSHKEPAIVIKQRRRPGKVFCKDCALIEVTVTVRIDEQANAAEAFVAALGIVAHFDDKQPAIFIEAHGDGIDHERLRRDKVETESGLHLECAEGLGRFDGRNSGQVSGIHLRFGGSNRGESCC